MKQNTIQKVVLSGLFAAIIAIVTYFVIPVPMTHGYVNLGDCFVILAGLVLGPTYGFLAAGIGSGLADIFVGYVSYAPVTFLVKGLMALAVYFIAGKNRGKFSVLKTSAASVVAELIMICGYFAYELVLYGGGAVASIPGNSIQGVFGAVAGVVLSTVLFKTKIIDKISK